MATHSSMLAWRIPWTEEPGRLHTVHEATKSWTQLRDLYFQFNSSLGAVFLFKLCSASQILFFLGLNERGLSST